MYKPCICPIVNVDGRKVIVIVNVIIQPLVVSFVFVIVFVNPSPLTSGTVAINLSPINHNLSALKQLRCPVIVQPLGCLFVIVHASVSSPLPPLIS